MADADLGEIRGIISLKDAFSGPIEDVTKKLFFFNGALEGVKKITGTVTEVLGGVTEGIIKLGERGTEVSEVQDHFAGLARAANSTAEVMLGALREGTRGTLTDFELMRIANAGLADGFIHSADDARTLAGGAKELAERTGGSTTEAFNTLTHAIESGRTTHLKQLGLFVDSRKAIDDYAIAHGKAKGELNDHERAAAVAAATLDALKSQFGDAKEKGARFGEMIEEGRVGVRNFVDALAVQISQSPVLLTGLQTVGEALGKAFGASQGALVTGITKLVEYFAIGLVAAAQAGVIAAKYLVQAWYVVEAPIRAVQTVILDVGRTLAQWIQSLAEMGTKIPVVGEKVKGFADAAGVLNYFLRDASQGQAKLTQEAVLGAQGQDAIGKALSATAVALGTARTKMEEAIGSHANLTKEAKKFPPALEEASAAAKIHADKIKLEEQELADKIDLIGRVGIDKRLKELKVAEDKEIRSLRNRTDLTGEEMSRQEGLIRTRYSREADLARLGSDTIRDTRTRLQNDIVKLTTTGTAQQLAAINEERQKEIDGLAPLQLSYTDFYNEFVAQVNEKYKLMTEAAQGHYSTAEQYAHAAGFKSREELQEQYDKAKETYDVMLKSGKFTYSELEKAHSAMIKAEDELEGKHTLSTQEKWDLIASSTATVLKSLFGKSKAAAYAATLIETAAAVITSIRNNGGVPWGLVAGAAAAAAGAAQLAKISQTNANFAAGTPDLTYANFGAETPAMLHGDEAVVPRSAGPSLGKDVADELRRQGVVGGGVRTLVVKLEANGRKLAQVVVPEIPRLLAANGVGL